MSVKVQSMDNLKELIDTAKTIPKDARKKVIMSLSETDLHKYIKKLFERIDPQAIIEITHGSEEYGKDLVMIKKTPFGEDIVGIIIKKGDIKGKTKGLIDEIKSQIEQSFQHKVKLKNSSKSFSISESWIILAGEISKNAHERLENEIREKFYSIKIFDIIWLIDKFTEYFPEVFFEGDTIDYIQEKIKELEFKFTINDKQLSEYFIPPFVANFELPAQFDEESLTLTIRKERKPFTLLENLLKESKRILLLGEPGVGKSVALAKLTLDLLIKARKDILEHKEKIELPINITAHEFRKYYDTASLLKENNLYHNSKLKVKCIMIDGLDEISKEERKKLLEKAEQFANELKCSLIITTRKVDFIQEFLSKFKKYELLPFELNQAFKFIERFLTDKKKIEILKNGIEQLHNQIILTPISLYHLIELVEQYKEVPASITELYNIFLEGVLGRFDKDKGLRILFDYHIKKKFLSELAYYKFYKNNFLEIFRNELDEFLYEYSKKYDWKEKELENFIIELERSRILSLDEKVKFTHRSYLDFFIANFLYENREKIEDLDKIILELYFSDLWNDAAFFYIGLKRELTEDLLEKILSFSFLKDNKERKENGDKIIVYLSKILIGRLLQAGWHSTVALKKKGIEGASSYFLKARNLISKMLSNNNLPDIYSDFVLLVFSELSFGSNLLSNQLKDFIEDSLIAYKDQESNNILKLIYLFNALRRFLTKSEAAKFVEKFLDCLSDNKISKLEEIKIILLLSIIEEMDKPTLKRIRRELNKLAKKYPETFRAILPSPKKGFRNL